MTDNQPIRDQSRAIREQHDAQPAKREETAREARWRRQSEQAQEEAKRNPHKGY